MFFFSAEEPKELLVIDLFHRLWQRRLSDVGNTTAVCAKFYLLIEAFEHLLT